MGRTIAWIGLLAGIPTSAWAQCTIVNSASYQPGLPSGGALGTAFCSGVTIIPGTIVPGLYVAPPSSPLPFMLGNVGVEVNQAPAPILAVFIPPGGNSSGVLQVNFQVPLARDSTALQDTFDMGRFELLLPPVFNGTLQPRFPTTPVPGAGQGGFFADANGYAIAQHASDHTAVTVDHPAHAGETISVFANDFFPVWPPPPLAVPVPSAPVYQFDSGLINYRYPFYHANLFLQDYPPYQFGIGSVAFTEPLQVVFKGLAVNQIGVEEIRFVVPATQAPGDWALFFLAGSCQTGSCGPGIASVSVKLPVR